MPKAKPKIIKLNAELSEMAYQNRTKNCVLNEIRKEFFDWILGKLQEAKDADVQLWQAMSEVYNLDDSKKYRLKSTSFKTNYLIEEIGDDE